MIRFQLRHGNDLLAVDCLRKCDVCKLFVIGQFVHVQGVLGVDSISRICTRMAHAGAPYFPMGRPKKLAPHHHHHDAKRSAAKTIWPHTLHQIFGVCRGHKVRHNDKVLRGFDEGILREKGEEKNLTTHISPLRGQGVLKFLWLTEIYRTHVRTRYRALKF